MEQEYARKELLEELCSLLPFGVMCWTPNGNGHLCSIDQTAFSIEYGVNISATKREYFEEHKDGDILVKPYLRPMSSMTGEMLEELNEIGFFKYRDTIANVSRIESKNGISEEIYTYLDIKNISALMEFFHSHHIDYRGLIEKGLALEAPEGMYKTE